MASSIRASKSGLNVVDAARKAKGWNKSDPRWAEAANVSVPTLKRFWRKTAITQESFVLICQAVDLDWQDITDLGSANLEDLLHQGVDVWNEWKHNNPPQGYSLAHMDLRGMNLQGADLSNTSLTGSNFSGCKLNGASLAGSDLTSANFNSADLREANLTAAQAIGTIFTGAMLTGACIENWNINPDTHLENITCSYVYLKMTQHRKSDRRPRQGIFKTGEFTALFQKAVDTVELIFQDGIDWQVFFQSFQELRDQYADKDISLQGIEKKKGGAFVVRLEVPTGAEKNQIEAHTKDLYRQHQFNHLEQVKQEIEDKAKRLYEERLKTLEVQYEKELRSQGEFHSKQLQHMLEVERQSRQALLGILTTMADNQGPKYDIRATNFSGGFAETVQGTQIGGTINGPVIETPSLAEAASEIQALLQQLEASNPTATEEEQTAFLNMMIPPTKRDRFISALKSASGAAIEEIPYGSVLKALIEGWQKLLESSASKTVDQSPEGLIIETTVKD